MSDFKAEIHQNIRQLTALPQAPTWILGAYF